MEFLNVMIFIIIISIIARFFFKGILVIAVLSSIIYLILPHQYKIKLDEKINMSLVSQGFNKVTDISKKAATKISAEAEKLK